MTNKAESYDAGYQQAVLDLTSQILSGGPEAAVRWADTEIRRINNTLGSSAIDDAYRTLERPGDGPLPGGRS